MWMARQNIFTDCKVKPETDDTTEPSSPAEESYSLLSFLKAVSIFNRKQQCTHFA